MDVKLCVLAEDEIDSVLFHGFEAEPGIEAMRFGHGIGNGVEIDGGVVSLPGAVEEGFGELLSETMTAMLRADPEAFHFAGGFVRRGGARGGERFQCSAAGGPIVEEGEQEGSVGRRIQTRKAGEFLFVAVETDMFRA